jgi:hypothetical protein
MIGRACMLILPVCPFGAGYAFNKGSAQERPGQGGITLSQDHMKAEPVEFAVTNTSTDPANGKVHEF